MNNIFVSWKQKIESRIISDLKSQYTESEEQIRQRKEQFLKKQKKIILIEIIAGAVFLAFLRSVFGRFSHTDLSTMWGQQAAPT